MTKEELKATVLKDMDLHKEKMESLQGDGSSEAQAQLAVHKTKFYEGEKFYQYLDDLEDECCVHH